MPFIILTNYFIFCKPIWWWNKKSVQNVYVLLCSDSWGDDYHLTGLHLTLKPISSINGKFLLFSSGSLYIIMSIWPMQFHDSLLDIPSSTLHGCFTLAPCNFDLFYLSVSAGFCFGSGFDSFMSIFFFCMWNLFHFADFLHTLTNTLTPDSTQCLSFCFVVHFLFLRVFFVCPDTAFSFNTFLFSLHLNKI